MNTPNENSPQTGHEKLEASFSMLIMSIASSALMSLGLSPDPHTGKMQPDKNVARFNIDLLAILKEKTKTNLTAEEQDLLTHILQDLQMKFLQMK
ncbi:MAG: hypothetical protein A2622_09740 [Bdellovibrionales bacterium RIFCSPHIGHO2_01_FULL_40_29]|nr:MAG: hypothetical protein A2622_09740 [Bdellovibrionales bacterium RIFCSPHIGHO2_01_FULL_40_29]OFZ32470.1 MAG: hypothetical protein A3D17_12925 [Bdellovibrionales bacterium RIFCSPHIGHO2_02_FULL_40_15]